MYIIIVGSGTESYAMAEELSNSGHRICILEHYCNGLYNYENKNDVRIQRVKALEFDSDKLKEAGILQADAVYAATTNDCVNMTLSCIADRIYHVPLVLARMNNPCQSYNFEKLGIKAINPIKSQIELLKERL